MDAFSPVPCSDIIGQFYCTSEVLPGSVVAYCIKQHGYFDIVNWFFKGCFKPVQVILLLKCICCERNKMLLQLNYWISIAVLLFSVGLALQGNDEKCFCHVSMSMVLKLELDQWDFWTDTGLIYFSLSTGNQCWYWYFCITQTLVNSHYNACIKPGVSNSNCSMSQMRPYEVTRGLHYDTDATMAIPEPY